MRLEFVLQTFEDMKEKKLKIERLVLKYVLQVQTEGYASLFRGLNSAIIRAFPTNAATFAVVTWTYRLLGDNKEKCSSVHSIVQATGKYYDFIKDDDFSMEFY